MKKTWGIIGLGWLGENLSQELKVQGHATWGTHRDTFDFQRDEFPRRDCDVLFLNTPPLTSIDRQEYAHKILKSTARQIIFVSSTSVYGNFFGRATEVDQAKPESASAKWLSGVEDLLRQDNRVLVIRPGGLIGGTRHPIFSLSGKTELPNGNHSVNLIHRDDLVDIIIQVSQHPEVRILNAVSPEHPTRENYYNSWADRLMLPKVSFLKSSLPDRVIDSDVLTFLYPNWKNRSLDFI